MGRTQFHKNGYIGKLHNLLTSLPKRCLNKCVTDNNKNNCCSRLEKYLCLQRNPVLQFVYLTLFTANAFLYFITIFKMIPNVLVPSYHRVLPIFVLIFAYASYWKACFSNPGNIDPKNQDKYANSFLNDELLYFPNRKCETCGIIKPPRSKHCTVTNKCVSKFDHYCIWVNNDVGELNYRWFHLFLISNFVSCFYGVYVYTLTLYSVVIENNLFNVVFMTPTGERVHSNLLIVIQYMLGTYLLPIAQTFFIAAIALMLFGFWLYHFYLTVRNRTTNETFKWEDIDRLYKIVRTYRKNASNPDDMETLYHKIYHDAGKKKDSKDKKAAEAQERKNIEKEWRLKQLKSINEMVKNNSNPKNAYDKGFWNNIKEVILPPSLYKKSKFS
jgi:hypothetical protein